MVTLLSTVKGNIMTIKQDRRNNAIYVYMGRHEDGRELLELLNKYRKLEGMSWRSFVLLSIAGRVAKDNPNLAQAVVDYVVR